MLQNYGLGLGLSTIPIMTNGRTRSISAENLRGDKGAGGKEASHLGTARKGRPFIGLAQGETVTLMEIAYFHSQWRRENITNEAVDYTIVDNITGKGHYVGTYMAWAMADHLRNGNRRLFWWAKLRSNR